jgi:hypothetical protein
MRTKKSIITTAAIILFIGGFIQAQSLKQYTWDTYKTKFKIGSDFKIEESTGDYFSAGTFDINLTISPQKASGMTYDKMESGLRTWVKDNNVTPNSEGYKYLNDLNGYWGVMVDGYYNTNQQVFLMMVMDPDYTDIQLYVWIAYNSKSFNLAKDILNSFTPN